ncbi:uncharacterized protein LOC124137087 isoform X1 [Haliotis rufescens]|uniref:uncharacterized protein LOC124137087 isoform X1 n=1 Tax=Haliotis rufescens TaxID=6454 RepID=UPI00201F71E3|nr:uncharacterized protein LOC124137087 isoform X1 [Haliotis rufescens]
MASTGDIHAGCLPCWTMAIATILLVCDSIVLADQLTFGMDPTASNDNAMNRILTTNQSWWDAQRECSLLGGNMYVPPSQSIPEDIIRQLHVNVPYWVGAITYPNWIWTRDHSPLYSYMGYRRLTLKDNKTNVDGNSAVACHQHCREQHTVLGLRGDGCYCLGNWLNSNDLSSKRASEVRCPGNYEEFCGNDNGVSVYRMENVNVVPLPTSGCCYVGVNRDRPRVDNLFHIRYRGTTYYPYLKCDSACDVRRRMSACEKNSVTSSGNPQCEGKVCLRYVRRSWVASNTECSLIKVTAENAGNLTLAMVSRPQDIYQQYWVGLERESVRKWVDGNQVILPSVLFSGESSTLPKCLAVGKTSSTPAIFFWIECSKRYGSVCEGLKLGPSTVAPSTGVTPTARVTSIRNTTTPTSHKTHPSTTYNTTLLYLVTDTAGHKSQNIGVYVGVVIGSLVLLSGVMVLVFTYRMKRLCFRAKLTVTNGQTIGFNASAANATYSAATALSGDDNDGYEVPVPLDTSSWNSPYYSAVPIATVKPNSHIQKALWTRNNKDTEQELYCNIKSENDGRDQPERLSGCFNQKPDKDCYENIILQSGGQEETEENIQVTRAVRHYQNTNEAMHDGSGVKDAHMDGVTVEDDDGIYQLAGEVDQMDDRCMYKLASEPNSDKRGSDAPYNTLGQRMNNTATKEDSHMNVYDRVTNTSSRDGYDTMTRQAPTAISDNVYSHAGDVDADFKLDGVDDRYDTTRSQPQRPRPDDYSYAHELDLDDDCGVDGDWEMDDDTYQYIEDVEDLSDEETCYYNLSFTAQGGNSMSTPSGTAGDDGVNSREGISDA